MRAFQSLSFRSESPETRIRPSSEKASASTSPWWPSWGTSLAPGWDATLGSAGRAAGGGGVSRTPGGAGGGTQGRALTRAYLSRSLEALGYKPELHAYRPTGTNVFTRLMADTPSNEYILIGAHMDSVRNAGADDNASGSVAVLEAAAVLKNLPNRKVNLLFAWFDEEEIGLVGSRYLAKELGPRGIAVNVVAPGAIETDFGGGAVRDNAQLNAFIAGQTALGRVGVAEDIGPLVAALLQPATRWVNAQRIEASGGMFL